MFLQISQTLLEPRNRHFLLPALLQKPANNFFVLFLCSLARSAGPFFSLTPPGRVLLQFAHAVNNCGHSPKFVLPSDLMIFFAMAVQPSPCSICAFTWPTSEGPSCEDTMTENKQQPGLAQQGGLQPKGHSVQAVLGTTLFGKLPVYMVAWAQTQLAKKKKGVPSTWHPPFLEFTPVE